MKMFSKVMVGVLAMAAALVVRPVRADQGWQDFSVTNTVRSNTTVTVNLGTANSTNGLRIDKQDAAAVVLSWAGSTAGNAGVVTVTFQRSIDGTNWETHPKITMLSAVNGLTQVTEFTNLTSSVIGGAGWIRPLSIQNADTVADMTNVFLLLSKKTIKPSP